MSSLSIRLLQNQRDLLAGKPVSTYSQEDLSSVLHRIFPSIQTGLKSLVNYFDTKSHAGGSLNGMYQNFVKALGGRTYGDIWMITIPVPHGLTIPYLTYIDILNRAADFAIDDVQQILNEYTMYLAGLVTTHQAMMESTNLNVKYVKQDKQRKECAEEMAQALSGGAVQNAPMKTVVKRLTDWEAILVKTDALSMRMNSVDRSQLNKKIKEATDLLDLLGKRVTNGELKDISPEVLMHLSEGAYQLGMHLEFFAVVYYRVSVLNQTVLDDVSYLIDCMKPQ